MYTSRSTTSGIKRGTRVHRAALAQMLGAPLPEDKQVHHQDFDKLNNCPRNLVLVDAAFNPAFALRDPYTGEYMSPSVWHRRYGEIRREQEIPDWVVNEQYIESQYATARV